MGRAVLNIVILVAILIACSVNTAAEGRALTVVTDPPGALVTIEGEVMATGVSPVRFNQIIAGEYDVEVMLTGYGGKSRKVKIGSEESVAEVSFKLGRKTRLKGALRSMVIPGWGTAYAGHKTRGQAYFILSTASVVSFFLIEDWFQNKHDTYQEIRARYKASRTVAEQKFWYGHLTEAQKDAYDAENVRRATIGVVAGIYVVNVLDAFLFPEPAPAERPTKRLGLRPVIGGREAGVRLTLRF